MRTAARSDANQREIVEALRRVGATVEVLSDVGRGVPDLLVGWRSVNYLLEVKASKGALTETQTIWHTLWSGQVSVVRTVDEAFDAIGVTGQ